MQKNWKFSYSIFTLSKKSPILAVSYFIRYAYLKEETRKQTHWHKTKGVQAKPKKSLTRDGCLYR